MPTSEHTVRLLAVAASVASLIPCPARAASPDLVISQVYGGGGNSGAPLRNDFIEIFNRGSAPVSLSGKSVQYTSATGTGNFGSSPNLTVLPNVSLAPGQYFLVQGAGGTTGVALPAADVVGTINMSATGGKVALVNSTAALACNGGSTPCSANQLASIIDLVGYDGANFFEGSPAPALSNTTAAIRNGSGCTDTDNNGQDFSAGAPAPRNTASAARNCTAPTATASADPPSVSAGDSTTLSVTVTPGTSPTSTGLRVFSDLSPIGGSVQQEFSDAGGGLFTFVATVAGNTSLGTKTLLVAAVDAQGRTGLTSITLTVVPQVAIHDIQGTGLYSPWAGTVVETEGIVTAIKTNGYFIQAPDSEADADPNTPEGIFVFTSSAPPPAANVGNRVRLSARVQDFIPSADPLSPPVTELTNTVTVSVVSTNNVLPAVVNLGSADFNPAGGLSQLAKYEGMRVHVDDVDVVAPTGGSVTAALEPAARSTSNGTFYGVLPGTPRPFREPGIEAPTVPPLATIPQFDFNPERVRVDSDGQVGATSIEVATGAHVSNLTGVLDFGFRTYTLLPDPGSAPIVTNNDLHAIPVRPAAGEGELTVASFNMERFFDTTKDSGTQDVALNADAFDRRLAKASMAIRNVMRMPDVIGVEEMEHLSTLQAVAARVDADAIAAGQTPPNYQAYLVEGNDIGGIDVGLLVKTSRIDVLSVDQLHKDATYVQPGGATALLNDRPPLLMRASVKTRGKEMGLAFTFIVNHLRSLGSIEDATDGARVRLKRLKQAEDLAGIIDGAQHDAVYSKVISVGDYNAFDVNDGYVDVIGIVRGAPAPFDQDVLGDASQLVSPPLIDLAPADPSQHYSYVFDGNAQVLDHIIVSQALQVNEFTYTRNDADFPESFRNDPTRPERISDHDMPVAYVAVPRDLVAPVVTVTGVSDGAIYRPDTLPVAGCSTADDASGVAASAVLSITGANADGTGALTATCSGGTDNVGNVAAPVSVHYIVDGQPPQVALTGAVDGAFYQAPRTPACTTTDDLSGVRTPAVLSISGADANGEGKITATCSGAVDNAGNVAADVTVHYVVDATPPAVVVTGVSEGAVYRAGAVPVIACLTADLLSGVRTPAFLLITGGNPDGTGYLTATCTGASDNAGNVANDVSVHFAVDGMPPVVTLTGPVQGATYVLGAVPAASCTTVDDIAGVATEATLSITGGDANGLGLITASCAGAVDNVGNVSPAVSVQYTVAGYGFGGFGPPAGGSVTVARSGSTVPLKFQVRDWTGALVSDVSVIRAIEYAPNAACSGTPSSGWQPAVSANPVGLRFDAGAQGFTFQWKTTGIAEGCYSVSVTTVDTLRHSTLVQIRGATKS